MVRRAATVLLCATALLVVGVAQARAGKPPHIEHVFIIVFENKNFADTFRADDPAPYLSNRLTSRGELLTRYFGTAHDSNANYLAMVSGQGPNIQTQADCQIYSEFLPGIPLSDGQYLGQGCVYPRPVKTIANQLDRSGLTWKAYQEEMNMPSDRPGTPGPCRHPAINSPDAGAGGFTDGYVTKHNPFVYFHSIIDFPTCKAHDVDLVELASDLERKSTTPSYSFITPTMCNDGHNEPCENGKPGGYPQIDAFLRRQVPPILRSPGYRDHGLLIITFDEAHSLDDCIDNPCPSGADSRACCGEKQSPNTLNNGGLLLGRGGGRIGAVLLSPCIRGGTVNRDPYNHYSMLRSIEDNFDLRHLGYAGQRGLKRFDSEVLNRPGCRTRIHLG